MHGGRNLNEWNLYSIMAERRDLYLWDSPDSGSGHTGHTSHNHNMSSPPSQTSNGNVANCDSIFPVPGAFHSRLQGCKDPMPNRVQDLQCGPNQGLPNSFSPPSSIQNNHNQLVVPQPLKPIKTKKSYQCKMCDQKFCNKSDVYRHGKETHGLEDKAHPCPHCYKSFSSPSQLHQHSLVHTGERKYHCKYCNKAFKQLSHLQQHTRIHTGEKPYKCSIPNCNKAFAQLSNLQHHQRNHDQNKAKSSRKSFYCTVCQRGFVTESSLDKHIARLHAHLSSHSMNSHVNSPVKVTASLPMSPSTSSGPKSSPHSPPVMSPEPNNGQINQHLHQMVAQGMQNLQSHGGLTSPLPHRHMSASSNNLMDDGGLSDPMVPLRSPVDQDNRMQNSQIQAAHTGQRSHHHHHQQQQNMLSSMGVGTHTGLPPISRLSDRCFPLAPPLPAAALAAVRAQALSSLNYGSPSARASIANMHRSTSPNGHQT